MFDNLDPEKLRSMIVDQLKTACKNWIDERTKRQLIILIMALKTLNIDNYEIQDREEGEGDSRGQLWQLRVVRDILGSKLRSMRFDYTYYPLQSDGTQPRDTITITEMDANNKVISTKKLKHYPDGRQPEWVK